MKTISQVRLPENVEHILSLGPKFAAEPKLSAPQQLSLVPLVSWHADSSEADGCISEGIDALNRSRITAPCIYLSRTASTLRKYDLCLLPSDKEGGCGVLRRNQFCKNDLDGI